MRGHYRWQPGERRMQPKQIQPRMRSTGKDHKSDKGQAAVELALLIPFLLLLIVGVADVARIFSEHLAVVNAAGSAARWSTLEGPNKGCSYPSPYSIEADVVRAEVGPALANQVTSVQVTQSGGASTTVQVTYNHVL